MYLRSTKNILKILEGDRKMTKITLTERQIDNRVEKYIELKAQMDELKKAQDTIKAELEDFMKVTGVDTLETKKHKVTYKQGKAPTKFNEALFKKEEPKLYDKYYMQFGTGTYRFLAK